MESKRYYINTEEDGTYIKVSKKYIERKQEQIESDSECVNNEPSTYMSTDIDNLLIVSTSPHAKSNTTTKRIMLDVIIALLPCVIASFILFPIKSLILIPTTVLSCVLFEYLFSLVTKRKNTICDLSAVVTGIILALNLSPENTWWQAVIGSFIAIVIVKCLFGGLGKNFANPAITARVVLLLSFAATGASGISAIPNLANKVVDVVSTATPLTAFSKGEALPGIIPMLVGLRGGALGEGCILAILIGFVYLVVRKVISWYTPVSFILFVYIFTLIFYPNMSAYNALILTLSGGVFFGAIFMATDYVTTPSRPLGRIIFGISCALITCAIRRWGNYPEGVSFSILFMNIVTPYIDRLTERKPFGGLKHE